MSAHKAAGRARKAVRDSWGITQFAVMIAATFAPVYVGTAVGVLLPIGNVTDRAGWLLGVLIVLLPLAWFVVSQPLVLIGRLATRMLLHASPKWSNIAAEMVESAIAYVVLVLCMRSSSTVLRRRPSAHSLR